LEFEIGFPGIGRSRDPEGTEVFDFEREPVARYAGRAIRSLVGPRDRSFMTDSSRAQGGLICIGAVIVGAVFLLGLLNGAWWAVAIPVGILLAFVLGLTFWVGWTIATVEVEAEPDPGAPSTETDAASDSDGSV
jgi:hypothetical protein